MKIEQWEEWMEMDATQELFKFLEREVSQIQSAIGEGACYAQGDPFKSQSCLDRNAGKIEALTILQTIDHEDLSDE